MAKLNLIPKNSGIALIFPVNVKKIETPNLNETTITEKNLKPIGFILSYKDGMIKQEPITSMTSTTNNSIIEFNDNKDILYNVLSPSDSFVKKLYFKKEYSPLNFWTEHKDGVEHHEPKIFKYHLNGESETTMKGGNMNRIQLKSAVYGDNDKKFFYQFDVEAGNYNENGVEIKSIKFNKIVGEHVEEYGIQDGITHEGGGRKWYNPLSWFGFGRSEKARITPATQLEQVQSRGPLPLPPPPTPPPQPRPPAPTPPPQRSARKSSSSLSFSSRSSSSSLPPSTQPSPVYVEKFIPPFEIKSLEPLNIELEIDSKNFHTYLRTFLNLDEMIQFRQLFSKVITRRDYTTYISNINNE